MTTSKPNRLLLTLALALLILVAFVISGFTLVEGSSRSGLNPSAFQNLTNAIRNGDFEQNPASNVATYWQPYDNGQAHFGWYDEKWAEAVHSGYHSQLLEIFQVEGNVVDRVIGIHQTIGVVPGMVYSLTMFAMMRSDAPIELRNKGHFSMAWGVDYSGQGKYHLVQTWNPMTLTEQLRIGSNTLSGDEPDRLVFETITGTLYAGNSNSVTLFIRGVKHEPNGIEVNFNIDDVSVIGPYPPPPTPTATPTASPTFPPTPTLTPTSTPTPTATLTPIPPPATLPALPVTGDSAAPLPEENNLPAAGAILPKDIPFSALLLGGALVIVLGVGAVRGVLRHKKRS